MAMVGAPKLKLRDVNEHLICAICNGYFIDATTIIECLHSFCRSCIVTHMMINRCCPTCEVPAHKTRPLLNIRSDKTLQDIVYKLVPDLQEKEREQKKKFHEETGIPMDAEEIKRESVTLSPQKTEHRVSISLEHDSREVKLSDDSNWTKEDVFLSKRYLRCYDGVCISTVNKLLRKKLRRDDLEILSFCRGEILPESYTLSDITNTFSWKSDRPLSLTYMAFSASGRKRKILEPIENDVDTEMEIPCKKPTLETPTTEIPKQIVSPMLKTPEKDSTPLRDVSKPRAIAAPVQSETPMTASATSNQSGWKPSQQYVPPKSTPQMSTMRNMSYSVRNVPFDKAVTTTTSEPSRQIEKSPAQSEQLTVSSRNSPCSPQHSSASFSIPNPQGKTKSINSIANRLQMEKVKSGPIKIAPRPTASVQETLKVQPSQPLSSHPVSTDSRSSWMPTDTSPNMNMKMKRNLMAQRINASNFGGHGLNDDMNNMVIRQNFHPGNPGSRGRPSINHDGHRAPNPTTSQAPGNFIRIQVNNEPPSYPQATSSQNSKLKVVHHRQPSVRPKYTEIQPKIPGLTEQQKLQRLQLAYQQPYGRKPNANNSDDSQLLSTTRQLASLREQQKILNEIAAAVAAKNPNLRTTESIRAAFSSLSPKSSMPRMQSPPHTSQAMKRMPSAPGVRRVNRPVAPVNPGMMKNPNQPNGSPVRSPRINGKSFSEVPRMPQDIGYPALNKPREGRVDIYQDTIARAKAQVMQMREHQHRNQIRAAISPYNVQNPNMARKPHSQMIRPPSHPSVAQSHSIPTKSVSPISVPHRSNASTNYRGLHTRPPPPPTQHRVMNTFSNCSPMRQYRPTPPPPPSYRSPLPRTVKPTTADLPVQEEPLCLVVKK